MIKPVHPRLGWIVRSSPEVLVGRGVLRADQGPRMNLERREGHQGRADDSLNGPQEGGGSQGQPVRMRFQNVTTCDNNTMVFMMMMVMLKLTVAIMAAG